MRPEAKLVPLGILEVDSGQLFLSLGLSAETSDFIADGIEHLRAWEANQQAGLRRLGESPATFPDTAALERRDCAAGGRSGALGIERETSELENASTRSGSSPVRTTEGLLAPSSAELFPRATWVSVAGMRDLAAQAPRQSEISLAAKSGHSSQAHPGVGLLVVLFRPAALPTDLRREVGSVAMEPG